MCYYNCSKLVKPPNSEGKVPSMSPSSLLNDFSISWMKFTDEQEKLLKEDTIR